MSATLTPPQRGADPPPRSRRSQWWLLFVLCSLYATFAASAAATEVLNLAGFDIVAKTRAAPGVFVAHALAGSVALVAGALQLNAPFGDGTGVSTAASDASTWSPYGWPARAGSGAPYDSMSAISRALFVAAAVLWFVATTIGFDQIRRRHIARHRNWMVRSFALSLFFLTFPPWVAALTAVGIARPIAYPTGLLLAWSANLLAAECWIRTPAARPALTP